MSDDFVRVYTEAGTVAHLLGPLKSPNTSDEALCGRTPWPSLWFGTGSQEEHERAADLRSCVACLGVVRHQRGL